MTKDTVIQIRISNRDKADLNELSEMLGTTQSELLRAAIDNLTRAPGLAQVVLNNYREDRDEA
jgi:hypothetical protein